MIIAMVLLASCSSSIVYKSLEELPTQSDYSVSFPANDSLKIGIKFVQTTKTKDENELFANRINRIIAKVYAADKLLDSISTTKFVIEKEPVGTNSIQSNFSTDLKWRKPTYLSSNMLNIDLVIETDKVVYSGRKSLKTMAKNFSVAAGLALSLTPKIQIENDSSVLFIVNAKRNYIVEKEYFPNSEALRIEILTVTGKLLYSSNYNANYFQVVKKVLPEEIGNTYEYKIYWDGKDNNHSKLPPGKYEVRMTLPAIPSNYMTQTTFDWRK